MARRRDYKAERERRNARARELGFSSLDALHRARKRGAYPSARAIKVNPQEARRARDLTYQLRNIGEIRKRSAQWSATHSRQAGTRYNPKWGDQRVTEYFNAFVRWWMVPNDERDFRPTYRYMELYADDFPEYDQDSDRY